MRSETLDRNTRERLQQHNALAAEADIDDPLQKLEHRLALAASQQRELAALAREIETRAQASTCALQFEDVESRVVVYSKQHALELREQLARIEEMGKALQAGIAADRDDLASKANRINHQSGKRRSQVNKIPCLDQQNTLDRDDGEMF